MPFPVAAAITAGAALVGQGAEMGMQSAKSKKQYHYTRKLQGDAFRDQQAMALFNMDLQKKMWEQTGPVGQMEQLKKAGLNPGLIYGMGGAGGQTANVEGGQGPNNQAASMPSDSGMGMMLGAAAGQAMKTQAEIDLMKAQADKLKADATYTGGAQTDLSKAETALKRVETKFQDASLEQRVANIANEGTKIMGDMRTSMASANIAESTQETVIEQYKENLAGTILSNTYTGQQTEESKAKIKKMGEEIAQGWKNLELKDKEIAINQQLANLKAEFPDLDNVFARDIRAALDKMWDIINPHIKRKDASTNYKK